jgi:enamine deaminase RidA (YjgF/YER057c/UK114 family)
MLDLQKISLFGSISLSLVCGFSSIVSAQDVTRLAASNPNSPYAEAVGVPPGYVMYFLAGATPAPANPDAPRGSSERMGDTNTQTISALNRLGQTLKALGLGYGDVVKATVYIVGDPAMNGDIDFAGMNKAWFQFFGTPQQPNKPTRSTVKVGLVTPGQLIEIETVAVKKTAP